MLSALFPSLPSQSLMYGLRHLPRRWLWWNKRARRGYSEIGLWKRVLAMMLCAAELTWSGRAGVVGEYQRAIDRMARSTLGAFRSTPLGILATESGLACAPARALLDHRQLQARLSQRLHARARNGQGPQEVLIRNGSALTTCLRAAVGSRPGESRGPGVEQEPGLSRQNLYL